ncbi:unnamed protein product [Rhizophagus irregularis]|nr:unnamed protein product [Rhizophagus irregularis]
MRETKRLPAPYKLYYPDCLICCNSALHCTVLLFWFWILRISGDRSHITTIANLNLLLEVKQDMMSSTAEIFGG